VAVQVSLRIRIFGGASTALAAEREAGLRKARGGATGGRPGSATGGPKLTRLAAKLRVCTMGSTAAFVAFSADLLPIFRRDFARKINQLNHGAMSCA